MNFPSLGTGFLFVALLVGSFVGAFAFMGNRKADSNEPVAVPVQASNTPKVQPETKPDVEEKVAPAPPEPEKQPERPITRAEASERGSIGRRVTWTCRCQVSQADGGHTQHIFFAEEPKGVFAFDNVFIAVEPEPYRTSPGSQILQEATKRYTEDAHRRFEELKRSKQKRLKGKAQEEAEEYWRLHPITVTGTISRLDTLLLFGHGRQTDVPVLKNITITAK
ncbi:hypothetical protein AYO44_12455 [Planctomycetaceae bacterium SCGC AG-212-F19]|nr:hypothetical protein AYO44_12455 [Planctomycetaceae bacterium SCGC AG-212-F19]